MEPGARLVVFCDDAPAEGPLHASFVLDGNGDTVALARLDPVSTLLDSISFGAMPPDAAFGIPAGGVDPALLLRPTPGEANSVAVKSFRRGDVNADGTLNIADVIAVLAYLFSNGRSVSCADAADANDSGRIDVADAVYTLMYLFAAGRPPASPFTECGPDPTADLLGCEEFPRCP